MKGLFNKSKFVYIIVGITLIGVLLFYVKGTIKGQIGYWPTKEWILSTPEEQGIDSVGLTNFVRGLKGKNVHSFMVIRNGNVITEAYNATTNASSKQDLLSATKSVTSALVGIAIKDDKIVNVEEKISDYFPELLQESDVRKKDIKVSNLLTMTSGLEWDNNAEISSNKMISSANWLQYLLALPLSSDPGTQFTYSNGSAHLLSALIQKATSKSEVDYAREVLFGPLGIKVIAWDSDPQGLSVGSFGLHLTIRDIAKFGYLYLNDGKWENKEIVSPEWIKASTKRAIEFQDADVHPSAEAYGYLWWLHSAKENGPLSESYAANGSGGQSIIIMPKQNMEIVITANNKDSFFSDPIIKQDLIPAIKSDKPIPENLDGVTRLAQATEEFKQEKDTL
jgi:CubicO group peptidase (beta-lactamase class C family)